jgi:two-component system, NarL family, nitrate/nitrite response regulator NarL
MSEHVITVMIADDQPLFRGGLRQLMQADHQLKLVGEAANGEQAVVMAGDLNPDLLLLDLEMPKLNGLQTLERLAPMTPKVLLMADAFERQQLFRGLNSGARGLITKDVNEAVFLKAIHCVHQGELWVEREALIEWARLSQRASQAKSRLTARERQIVQSILTGSTNREIAAQYAITERTVKRHLTNIFDKFGCSSRLELSLFAMYQIH